MERVRTGLCAYWVPGRGSVTGRGLLATILPDVLLSSCLPDTAPLLCCDLLVSPSAFVGGILSGASRAYHSVTYSMVGLFPDHPKFLDGASRVVRSKRH